MRQSQTVKVQIRRGGVGGRRVGRGGRGARRTK